MDHESAVEQLHDLHLGCLDDSSRRELEAHLAECSECRSLSRAYPVFRSLLEEERTPGGEHPTADEIVSLVYQPETIPSPDREAIEAHLERCRSCKAEVSNTRQVEASLSRGEGRQRASERWQPRTLLALAASILVAALAYPAFLGLVRLPRVERSADGLRQQTEQLETTIADLRASGAYAERELAELRDWSGAAPMQFVTSARRREALATEILVREGQPFVILGVDVGIPPELSDSEALALTIVDPAGTVADEVVLTIGEARRQILSTGVITLVVTSSSLAPGPYEMRVKVPGREDLAPFLEASLQVKSATP